MRSPVSTMMRKKSTKSTPLNTPTKQLVAKKIQLNNFQEPTPYDWCKSVEVEKMFFRAVVENAGRPTMPNILGGMLQQQGKHMPLANYLKRVQKDEINEAMRREIVTWIHKMSQFLKYQPETFLAAINFFDRSLSIVKARQNHLHLLAATCFLLASKTFEDNESYPTLSELVIAGNNVFQEQEIEKMERVLLMKLKWEMNTITTSLVFHQLIPDLKLVLSDLQPLVFDQFIAQINVLLEAFTLEYSLLKYLPSELVSAAILYTMNVGLGVNSPEMLVKVLVATKIDRDTLFACFNDLKMIYMNSFPVFA